MKCTFSMIIHPSHTPTGLEVWKIISEGPKIVRPTSANIFEPLKKIADIDVEKVCRNDFIWRNGRKCLGMFQPNGRDGECSLALLLKYPREDHISVVEEVQKFIHSNFKYRLIYGVEPNKELMEMNLEVHQLANCGAIPPDESIIASNQALFEFYEKNA